MPNRLISNARPLGADQVSGVTVDSNGSIINITPGDGDPDQYLTHTAFRSMIGMLTMGTVDSTKRRTLHAGVIRFDGTDWELINDISGSEGTHPPVGISSVTESSTAITINFATGTHGANPVVTSGWAVPDESFARDGFHIGPSISASAMTLQIHKIGVIDYISLSSSVWSSQKGYFDDLTWNSTDDRLEIRTDRSAIQPTRVAHQVGAIATSRGTTDNLVFTDGATQPADNRSTYRFKFYDLSAGAFADPPTDGTAFRVYLPDFSYQCDPTADFEGVDATYGYLPNIWFGAIIESDV